MLVAEQASAASGETWSQITTGGWNFHVSNVDGSREFKSADNSTLIATTGPRTILNFDGITFAFSSGHPDDCASDCEVGSNSDGSYLYMHTGVASLYVSRNQGTTWTRLTEGIGGRGVDGAMGSGSSIAVSPDGSSVAFLSYEDSDPYNAGWHIFFSSDFGASFTNISSDFETSSIFAFENWRALLFSSNFDLYLSNADRGGIATSVYKVSFPAHATVLAGSIANSKIATIPAGVTTASIPAIPGALPATTLNFGGSVPTSVTVVPVASNPAPASATPFTISGSTKIVDIQISGTFTGSATVCLDGASTDHLFHYTGGAWVELPSRSYVNGQVCGVTTSFSPFASAPLAALVAAPVPVPDPVQQSKITALSISSAIAGTPTPVVISGSFIEKISAIQINGVALASGSWSQTQTSVTFTMPGKSAGTYQIQIYNGSAPVMKVQNFTFTAPIVVVAPTPSPTVKQKVTYIRCAKPGHGTRIAYGVNPTCPVGYVKK